MAESNNGGAKRFPLARPQLLGMDLDNMKQPDFRKAGKVSVWVGNFASDTEMDDYLNLNRVFEDDFGFTLNERDMPETTVVEQPTPISQLADGFSWSELYKDKLVELAERGGIQNATTMIIFLNMEFDPGRAKVKPEAPLKFIGVVPFQRS